MNQIFKYLFNIKYFKGSAERREQIGLGHRVVGTGTTSWHHEGLVLVHCLCGFLQWLGDMEEINTKHIL